MTDTPQASGVDLARAALAAARANAKNTPAQPQRKKPARSRREASTGGRDPFALGTAITGMLAERGWQPPEPGGSIIDQWPALAPELADKVAAVRYEHDTGILHLRPCSDAYATQLRLFRPQLLRRLAEKTGARTVRNLKILPPGGTTDTPADGPDTPAATPAGQGPVRTREDGCSGYQNVRAIVLEHQPPPPPANPYVEEAKARQVAALRAGRQPESEHRDAVWAQDDADRKAGPKPGSMAASEAAARAVARRTRVGRAPRRAFDTA